MEATAVPGWLVFLPAALGVSGLALVSLLLVRRARDRRARESCMSRLSVAYNRNVVMLSLSELLDQLAKQPCKKRFIMLCGAQGSGKTTIGEGLAARGFRYLSMDKMVEVEPSLAMMYQELHCRFFTEFEAALKRGDNIVDDNQNISRSERSRALKVVRAAGYRDIVLVHLNVPLDVCLKRNASRADPVPEWIVEERWQKLSGEERPSPAEAPLIRVAPLDNEMRQCTMYLLP